MKERSPTLLYIYDPMCSWCWGFRPVLEQVKQALPDSIEVQYILGGLAADTDLPMPQEMQNTIRETWKTIQQEIPGTEFNYDFWTECNPRRSTYPACRAIIACRIQQPEKEPAMLLAIQQAYYLDARNPSEDEVLIQLAAEVGLDVEMFIPDFKSEACRDALESQILLARSLYVHSFPSLVLLQGATESRIHIDYNSSDIIIQQIVRKITAFS